MPKVNKVAKLSYPFKIIAYYGCLTIVFENYNRYRQTDPFIDVLVLVVVLMPHFDYFYLSYISYKRGNKIFRENFLLIDGFLLGCLLNALHFPYLFGIVVLLMVFASHIAIRGIKNLGYLGIAILVGYALYGTFNGYYFDTKRDIFTEIISVSFLSIYTSVFAYFAYTRTQDLNKARKDLEQKNTELASQRDKLLEFDDEKNHLIEILAHDLRSPLSQIQGLMQLLKMTSQNASDEQKDYFLKIERITLKMKEMIGKILDVNTVETSASNAKLQKIHSCQVLLDIIETFRSEAKVKNITLNYQKNSDDSCDILADAGYLYHIYSNLISNAIKFSFTNTSIEILQTITATEIITEIKDQGQGMSEEDLKKMFRKYQKLSAQPTAGEQSTGLGLSIVKKYTDAMNGKITCTSQVGKGTSFFVIFAKAS